MDRKAKCANCSVKVGLFGFSCRCARVFCSACRFPKTEVPTGHDCGFDFSQLGKDTIAKQNPKLVSAKLDII